MNKEFYKNTLKDLKEFNGSSPDWNESNRNAAKEWNSKAPKSKEEYEEYYRKSKEYINAMASYNQTGKKLRLYSKIKKIIESLGDVKSIVDFGCGAIIAPIVL
jgi:nucleosome binding factor SPN SPT16 subunit